MSEPTVLVTGATDGIGRATALALARRGFRVVVHGRSAQKVSAAREAVLAAVPGASVLEAVADLSSAEQVRALGEDLCSRLPRLDVLLNNAGIFAETRQENAAGVELTWMVNHLAPMLLTHALSPLLEASAPARVINVSSVAHQRAPMDPDDLELRQRWSGYGAYAQSKLGNVLFTFALARRVPASRFTVHALHPGVITTKLLATGFGGMTGADVEEGALTSVKVATAPEAAERTGLYWSDERVVPASARARDEALQERVWAESHRRLGISPDWV
jgi:retinol dehydrogenase-12